MKDLTKKINKMPFEIEFLFSICLKFFYKWICPIEIICLEFGKISVFVIEILVSIFEFLRLLLIYNE